MCPARAASLGGSDASLADYANSLHAMSRNARAALVSREQSSRPPQTHRPDDLIKSEIVKLNFSKNLIEIIENVHYMNRNTKIYADKVELDLLKKKMKISMVNPTVRREAQETRRHDQIEGWRGHYL